MFGIDYIISIIIIMHILRVRSSASAMYMYICVLLFNIRFCIAIMSLIMRTITVTIMTEYFGFYSEAGIYRWYQYLNASAWSCIYTPKVVTDNIKTSHCATLLRERGILYTGWMPRSEYVRVSKAWVPSSSTHLTTVSHLVSSLRRVEVVAGFFPIWIHQVLLERYKGLDASTC